MNMFLAFCLTLCFSILNLFGTQEACAQGFANEEFVKVLYFASGGTGNGSSKASPLPIADGNIFTVPAGTVIEQAYVVVDVAITGSTAITVGDATDPDGLCLDFASVFSSVGAMYCHNSVSAGAYLKIADASNGNVPNKKIYTSATALALDNTTTNTAGKFRLVIKGYRLPPAS